MKRHERDTERKVTNPEGTGMPKNGRMTEPNVKPNRPGVKAKNAKKLTVRRSTTLSLDLFWLL